MIVAATGITLVVGGATGNLAAMLGALFDPSSLSTTGGGNKAVSRTSSITNGIKSAITGTIFPGLGL